MTRLKYAFLICYMICIQGCKRSRVESEALMLFRDYYNAVKNNSDDRWNYTSDTVRLWFDDKSGNPDLQVKGEQSTGKWSEWDKEMNATSYYDSLWYDAGEHAVKGYFFENNDFYSLIGKSPTKTERTYWLNHKDKITEILIYWIPEENTMSSEHLAPVVKWALKNDSLEIQELYPKERIIPSWENAVRWKKLLTRYNEAKK